MFRAVLDELGRMAGEYADGEELPSTYMLADQLGVSVSTVHRALRHLVAQGRVVHVHRPQPPRYRPHNPTVRSDRFRRTSAYVVTREGEED